MTWEEYKAMKNRDAKATIEQNEVRTSKNSIDGMSWQEYKRKREEEREKEEEQRKREAEQRKQQQEARKEQRSTQVLPTVQYGATLPTAKENKIVNANLSQNAIDVLHSGNLKTEKEKKKEDAFKKQKQDNDKKWYEKFFEKSTAFDDGYNIGDVSKTVLGTATDVQQNIAKGLLRPIEAAGDLGLNIVASGVNLVSPKAGEGIRKFANKDVADTISTYAANLSPTGLGLSGIEDPMRKNTFKNFGNDALFENYSVLGNTSDEGISSIANMYAMKGLGDKFLGSKANIPITIAGHSINLPVLSGVEGAASGFQEANNTESTNEIQRWSKATTSALSEMVSESFWSAFDIGGNEITDKAKANIVKKMSTRMGKLAASLGISAFAEGFEEVLADVFNYIGDNLITNKLGKGDYKTKLSSSQLIEDFCLGALTTLIGEGGGNIISSNMAIQNAEKEIGRPLTEAEKADITQTILLDAINSKEEEPLPTATEENTYSNRLKQTAIEEINNSQAPQSEKKIMLEALDSIDNITDSDMSAIRETIKAYQQSNELETKGDFKNDQARRQKYMQYKNDTKAYNDSVVNEVLDTIPKNRNGRRTVKQWLQAADEIGKRIANLSNEEIEKIAYKSWFDIQPSKSITQYDRQAKQQVGFQKFTSDEWINTINKAVNEARANNQVEDNAKNNQSNNVEERIKQDSENFSKQVDDVINNKSEDRNMLTLLTKTPQALKDIGLNDLPITMTQKHLKTIINSTGNDKSANYHDLGIDIVKQLPEAINNPLDIVESNTRDDSIVLTTYLADKQKRNVIASIKIDGTGRVNDVIIDTNVMTSAYGRNNYEKWMQDNLNNDRLLYDIDKGVIKKVDMARLQLPRYTNFVDTNNNVSTSNNSIPSSTENVNTTNKYAQATENDTHKNINNKVQKYLDKTGLSSKMSVDEFINKAEKFTLENESNMTKEQQELYDIIKDIQNRDSIKEEDIGYNNTKNNQDIKNHYNDIVVREEGKEFKQDLAKQFKELTGDTINLAGAKLAGIEVRNNMRKAGNLEGELETNPYNKEAMDIYTKYQNSQKTSSYLYHATGVDRLESIIKNGLTIGNKQNQEGVSSRKEIYLSATPELAETYANGNSVTLRINPKFYDKFENFRQDYLGGKGAYAITNNIPPEMLQIKENNKWVNLTDSKQAKQIQTTRNVESNSENESIKNSNKSSFNLQEKIQGLENYNVEDLKESFKEDIKQILKDNDIYDVDIVDIDLHGSRLRGTARNNSDLDVVVQYNGDIREDDLFNILNENPLEIEGIKVDINPIQEDIKDYMDRSNKYDQEILSKNLNKDNQGRILSKEQQEYFKDSKVRDENGNLLTMYHGTDADFTIFDHNYSGKSGTGNAYGNGFYFTDLKETGNAYGNKVKEVYLDIKKPIEFNKKTLKKSEYKKLIEAINNETNGTLLEDYGGIDNALMDFKYGGDDYDLINMLKNSSGLSTDRFYEIVRNVTGFDGIKANNTNAKTDGNFWVVFNSNQIKDTTNTNPTNNPDIFKEEYKQLSIEGFNNESENNLAKENWSKYQEVKKKTNEVLKKDGTKIEVSKRKFSKDFVDNGYIDLNGKTINNAADIADTAQIFRNPKYETFRVIYMQGNTIVGQEAVSSKLPSESRPFTKNDSTAKGLYKIQNRMERLGADGYYLIHNHPTGTAKASNADINMTKVIDKKVKGFLGHVIINSGTYALIEHSDTPSFKDTLIWKDEIKIKNYKPDTVDKMMSKELWANTQIKNREDILNLAYDLKNNPNYSSLIMTDTKQIPRIVLDIPNKFLNMNLGQINGYIRNVARQNGADNAFIATQDTEIFDKMFFSNALRDCILYSVNENGDLIAKQSKTKENGSSRSIFQSTGNTAIRANEKIEDIYNSFFETDKKERSTYNTAPTADNVLTTSEFTKEQAAQGKFRKHYDSIMKSQYTTAEAKAISKELMGSDTYIPETNNEQLRIADERIRRAGLDSELNSLMSRAMTGGNIKSVDIAVGERLIQYYSKTGNKAKLQEAIQATAMAGTSAGQTVQAMSLLNHQTPEGQAIWLQRSVDRMNNQLRKTRGENADQFKLTPEMTEKIVNSQNTEELYKNLDEVYRELGQQVTKSTIQKIDAWRYFSMLANPKTHIRNIVGNVAMGKVQGIKNKVAGAIEDVISKTNPEMERTHTLKAASKEVKNFAKNDISNVVDRLELNENKYNPKTRLENSMRTFKSDAMENTLGSLFEVNNKALEVEDGWGLKAGYAKALSEYMTANKLNPDTITDAQLAKARNYAIEQAKEATFHQASALATALNQFSNKNKVTKFLTDATIPFKKTPINVAKAGIEYSPVGLAKSAIYDTVQLRKGNITVNQYIDNISKGLTGTGIALLGYALSSAGVLRADGDDDDKETFERERGKQKYSVRIGDKTYSLDWLAPAGIPLFIGAKTQELMQQSKEKNSSSSDDESAYSRAIETATSILDAFTNAVDPMTEMSMLSGLSSTLKSYDNNLFAGMAVNMGKSYVNQFVPTAVGQVAKTTDKYERDTTSTKTGTLPKAIDLTKNQIMSKIPGLRQQLPTKTNVWGEPLEQNKNVVVRGLENAVFPWTKKDIRTNNVDKELLKLYDNTGEKAVLPSSVNKNLTIDKQKYVMTSTEYAKYKKLYGDTSYKLLNSMINSSSYKNLNNEQKQKAIDSVYDYAKEQIKIDYAKQNKLDYEPSTLTTTVDAIQKAGGNASNYFEFTALTQGLSKESEKINVLTDSNYSMSTKKAIYENTLGKDDSKYGVVKNTNININEYLKYKAQNFSADKQDDGTINGKTISGSKKEKVRSYIENMNITYMQKLLLYGMEYTLPDNEQAQVANYINGLNKTNNEKLEMLSKFQGFTIYKDGSYKY